MYVSVYSYLQLVYRMSVTIEELLVYREAFAWFIIYVFSFSRGLKTLIMMFQIRFHNYC